MVSRAPDWRQRVRAGLAAVAAGKDPRAGLLERVVGEPTAELLDSLAVPSRVAAVLVGFVDRPGGPRLLLTGRGAHLKDHPGQISFPGGRLSAADADIVAAALRESHEEVGLEPEAAEVLGRLPSMLTVTGFEVTPVVAWIADGFEPRPDPGEVELVFELPLDFLLDRANHGVEVRERLGTRFRGEVFQYEGHRIWGATAAILGQIIEIING